MIFRAIPFSNIYRSYFFVATLISIEFFKIGFEKRH